MPLQITRITPGEFDLLRDEWNALLRRSSSDNVFLRWEWMHTWWTIFSPHKTLFILTAREEGRLLGIAPFYIGLSGLMKTRTLKLCSDELSPDYLDVMAEPDREADVARAFVNELIQRRPEWDVIALDNLRRESPLLADLSYFRDYHPTTQVGQSCPYVRIAGAFEDYYQSCSALASFTLKKKLKKLREEKKLAHTIAHDEETMSRGLAHLFLLHEKRAGEMHFETAFLSPDVQRFHTEISRMFLRERILSLHYLSAGAVPISVEYGFNYKNKIYSFQSGYDPVWRKHSVGAVMIYLVLEKAFQDGLDEFDFLKGNEGYKSLWSNAARDEMQFTVYNKSLRGSLERELNDLKPALRSIKQTLLRLKS